MRLATGRSRPGDNSETVADRPRQVARDEQYLYLAIHCPKSAKCDYTPDDHPRPTTPTSPTTTASRISSIPTAITPPPSNSPSTAAASRTTPVGAMPRGTPLVRCRRERRHHLDRRSRHSAWPNWSKNRPPHAACGPSPRSARFPASVTNRGPARPIAPTPDQFGLLIFQ